MTRSLASWVYVFVSHRRKYTCLIPTQYTNQQDREDIVYVSFLLMARAGIRALEYYDPSTGKHGQAHMQARYVDRNCFPVTNALINTFVEDWASPNS